MFGAKVYVICVFAASFPRINKRAMFANSSVGNNYRPDRKLLEAITALTAQVAALKARADIIPATGGVSMGSLGAVGMIGMRDGRPSFELSRSHTA